MNEVILYRIIGIYKLASYYNGKLEDDMAIIWYILLFKYLCFNPLANGQVLALNLCTI